jgi:hypothetical protein
MARLSHLLQVSAAWPDVRYGRPIQQDLVASRLLVIRHIRETVPVLVDDCKADMQRILRDAHGWVSLSYPWPQLFNCGTIARAPLTL